MLQFVAPMRNVFPRDLRRTDRRFDACPWRHRPTAPDPASGGRRHVCAWL